MCLYMSVPQWLNLQNFLRAINESINHTIDVSFMFIYLKCLNNRHNKNEQNNARKTTVNHIVAATQTNLDKNHKIDFNVNFKKINPFEMLTAHKASSEIGQMERILIVQHNSPKLQQLNQQKRKQYHHNQLPQQLQQQTPQERHQQQQEQHFLGNNDQLLLMDKFKTFPLNI